MNKTQEEILQAVQETNILFRQFLAKQSDVQSVPTVQKSTLFDELIKSAKDNPKTTVAGIATIVLGIAKPFFPEFSGQLDIALTALAGTTGVISRDAKPKTPISQPTTTTTEILG